MHPPNFFLGAFEVITPENWRTRSAAWNWLTLHYWLREWVSQEAVPTIRKQYYTRRQPAASLVIHILLSTLVAHTLLNTAHTVGSDCGCNTGWCRSHPTVSEMT